MIKRENSAGFKASEFIWNRKMKTFCTTAVLILAFLITLCSAGFVTLAQKQQPSVLGYRIVTGSERQLNGETVGFCTTNDTVGLIVRFSDLTGINIGNATAEFNYEYGVSNETNYDYLRLEAKSADSIKLPDGSIYAPLKNEIVFDTIIPFNEDWQKDTGSFELLIDSVTLDGMKLSVGTVPDNKVILDNKGLEEPEVSIVNQKSNYIFGDEIEIQVKYSEPVFRNPNTGYAYQIEIDTLTPALYPVYYMKNIADFTGNGTDTISFKYKIDEDIKDDCNIFVRSSDEFTDEAGNGLGDLFCIYAGKVHIDSKRPEIISLSVDDNFPANEYAAFHYFTLKVKDDDIDTRKSPRELPEVSYFWSSDTEKSGEFVLDPGYLYSSDSDPHVVDIFIYTNEDPFLAGKEGKYKATVTIKNKLNTITKTSGEMWVDRKPPTLLMQEGISVNKNGSFTLEIKDEGIGLMQGSNTIQLFRVGESAPIGQLDYEVPASGMDSLKLDISPASFKNDSGSVADALFDGAYELKVNAWDAREAGATLTSPVFNIDTQKPDVDTAEKTIDTSKGEGYAIKLKDNISKTVSLEYAFSEDNTLDEASVDWSVYGKNMDITQPVKIYMDYSKKPGFYNLFLKITDEAQNTRIWKSTDTVLVPEIPKGSVSFQKEFTNQGTEDVNLDMAIDSRINPGEKNTGRFFRIKLSTNTQTGTWSDWKPLNDKYTVTLYKTQSTQTLLAQYKLVYINKEFLSEECNDSIVYDTTAPTGTAFFSTKAKTYLPVTVTITNIKDNCSDPSKVVCNPSSYTFTENTTSPFIFTLTDEAGNVAKIPVEINWIANDAPRGIITYSTTAPTTQDVTAVLSFDKSIDLKKITVTNNDGKNSYTFTDNGTFIFSYKYEQNPGVFKYGNIAAKVSNIDRVKPNVKVEMLPEKKAGAFTSSNVTVIITPDENSDVVVKDSDGNTLKEDTYKKNGAGIRAVMSENGVLYAEVTDLVGNRTTTQPIVVDYIDQIPPVLSLNYQVENSDGSYSSISKTRNNVIVTVSAAEPVYILNNNGSDRRLFTENRSYEFCVSDMAGNVSRITAVVDKIDKSKPVLTVKYSTENVTNSDVTVEVTSDRPVTVKNNNGSNRLIFTENATKLLIVEDGLGNTVNKYIMVNNIDKEAPQIVYDSEEVLFLNKGDSINDRLLTGVRFVDAVDGDVTDKASITNNIDSSIEGTYSIQYTISDQVGNKAVYQRAVKVLGQNEIVAVVNGKSYQSDYMNISLNQVNFSFFGTEGKYKVWYEKGKYTGAYFKRSRNPVKNNLLTVSKAGWYTVYIQDQERKTKLIYLYFNI